MTRRMPTRALRGSLRSEHDRGGRGDHSFIPRRRARSPALPLTGTAYRALLERCLVRILSGAWLGFGTPLADMSRRRTKPTRMMLRCGPEGEKA
jgi:hypothetical protein